MASLSDKSGMVFINLVEARMDKKEWQEPDLTKGENLSLINLTLSPYNTHKNSDSNGCGILEEIITLGLCK
ncbi:MAG: hypothetical protein C4291_15150 [Candidatus Dadabacteria bacterium]